jgi:hypothetical protein
MHASEVNADALAGLVAASTQQGDATDAAAATALQPDLNRQGFAGYQVFRIFRLYPHCR